MKTTIIVIIGLAALGAVGYLYLAQPVAPPSATNLPMGEPLPPEPLPAASSTAATTPELTETFVIDGARSRVEFRIDEVLRGEDFTAVGATRDLTGEIAAAPGATTSLRFGRIKVNARTLKTDSQQRDGAIARLILKSEDPANEFIVFDPTDLTLATSTSEMTLSGNLTVSGVTKPVAFTGNVSRNASQLLGQFQTTLKRSDFNLEIPSVPFVASVADLVKVKVNFVAVLALTN